MSLFCALLISLHHEENKNTVGFKGRPGFDILGEVRCAEKQKSWKLDLVLVTNHTWEPFKMISTYLHVHIPQKESIKKHTLEIKRIVPWFHIVIFIPNELPHSHKSHPHQNTCKT